MWKMTQMLSYVTKREQPIHYWVLVSLDIINRKPVGLSEHVVWKPLAAFREPSCAHPHLAHINHRFTPKSLLVVLFKKKI